MNNQIFIGIDPGTNHPAMGIIAINELRKKPTFINSWKLKLPPIKSLAVYEKKVNYIGGPEVRNELIDCLRFIFKFLNWYNNQNIVCIGIEYPDFEQTFRGIKAASKGDLGKLIFSAGVLFENIKRTLHECCIYNDIKLIKPIQWKGHLPKNITRKRMMELYETPFTNHSDDEIDAIGIATYLYETYGHKPVSSKETTSASD